MKQFTRICIYVLNHLLLSPSSTVQRIQSRGCILLASTITRPVVSGDEFEVTRNKCYDMLTLPIGALVRRDSNIDEFRIRESGVQASYWDSIQMKEIEAACLELIRLVVFSITKLVEISSL